FGRFLQWFQQFRFLRHADREVAFRQVFTGRLKFARVLLDQVRVRGGVVGGDVDTFVEQGQGGGDEVGEDTHLNRRLPCFLAFYRLFFGQLDLQGSLRQADLDPTEIFERFDLFRIVGTQEEVVFRLQVINEVDYFLAFFGVEHAGQ